MTPGKIKREMEKTQYGRKLDSCGRLVLPIRLREELGLVIGETYQFFTHQEDGKTYLCIECPEKPSEIDLAIELLKKNGIKINVGEVK